MNTVIHALADQPDIVQYVVPLQITFACEFDPCHHCMAHLQVMKRADGLQVRTAAENTLNKEQRTTDNGCFSSLC
jgi:hypothetical protein